MYNVLVRVVINPHLSSVLYPYHQVTLELAPAQVASEYYTAEEMVQFKRPKKKRKIRKKEKLKADDLMPLDSQESAGGTASKDHGSRRLGLLTTTSSSQGWAHK